MGGRRSTPPSRLARMQEEVDALLTNERTIVAVRRDDLGYRTDNIDLSEMRFMRVVECASRPGMRANLWNRLRSSARRTRRSKQTRRGSCIR